ncbi:glycosyltransferase family 4 protein [Desulfotomaculum sp. 1211_IL3151]|uniref:glycosyltransferase family 4 protein n=1 Tax=Desulfotomaculum sp. 1211_IL3151 TaxID=3084055 RepID=UPI002FDB12AA
MRKKRVAICFSGVPFIKGGAELCVESLARELSQRGLAVEIVNLPFQWSPKQELIKNLVMWRLLNIKEFAGNQIDLVIATKFPSYVINHPNKVTWLFHQHRAIYDLYGTPFSDFEANNEEDNKIREQIIRSDNKTLAESRTIYTIAQNTSNRLKYYNNLDSTPLYHPPKHYGKYHCQQYGDYILSVGRLEGLKRIDLLLRSLKHTDQQLKCIIAGTGGMEGDLKKLAQELGLEHRVKFLGFVKDEDLLKLYANCKAVYFAPYDEDYGYITLEAFLSSKPVITCKDSGGVLEFAEHNVNAYVADIPEPALLGQYMNQLHNNPTAASELGNNGYVKVKDINWDHVITKLTEVI